MLPVAPSSSRHLAALAQMSDVLATRLDWKAVVTEACRIVVAQLGADHSGFVLFDVEHRRGHVVAEYPDSMRAVGTLIPIEGVLAEEQLIESQSPIVIADVAAAQAELGPVRDVLLDLGVRSILVVPVIGAKGVLGSFSLDFASPVHTFSEDDVTTCRVIASQIAVALADRQAWAEAEALRQVPVALGMDNDEEAILLVMVRKAVEVLQATGGGFYRYDQEARALRLVVDTHRPALVGLSLAPGVGMAGRLVESAVEAERSFLIVNDYSHSEYMAPVFDAAIFGSVVEVVVRGQRGIIGVLYVDAHGRQFFDFDARLLLAFAEPTAAAMAAAEISEKQRRNEFLLAAHRAIKDASNPLEGLGELASAMVGRLGPAYCRIWVLDERQQSLAVRVMRTAVPASVEEDWQSAMDAVIDLSQRPELREALMRRDPTLWLSQDAGQRACIAAVAGTLPVLEEIASILLVPLNPEERPIGLLEFGALRKGDYAFSPSVIDRIAAMSRLAISQIGDLGPYFARRAELFTRLEDIGRNLKGEKSDTDLRVLAARLAQQLVNSQTAGVYVNRSRLRELEQVLPDDRAGAPEILRHGMGPVGRAALEMATVVDVRDSDSGGWLPPQWDDPLHVIVAVPVKVDGAVDSVLYVGKREPDLRHLDLEREVLERFAERLGSAIHTSRLITPEQRRLNHVQLLLEITSHMHQVDSNKILHALATAVTAGFGLGFNRAVVLLVDESGTRLRGRMGVGYFRRAEQERAWKQPVGDITEYRKSLAMAGTPQLTEIGTWARRTTIPLSEAGVFADVMRQGKEQVIGRSQADQFPAVYRDKMQPVCPTAVIPLAIHNQVIGVLTVDMQHSNPEKEISRSDLDDLLAFASTAATALEHRRLTVQTSDARERLRALFKASTELVLPAESRERLQVLADNMVTACPGSVATFIVLAADQCAPQVVTAGEVDATARDVLLEQAYHGGAMSREHIAVYDTAGSDIWAAVPTARALLGIPMQLQPDTVGFVWVLYGAAKHFREAEVEALRLYVNQAALSYQSALRLDDLVHNQRALHAVSGHRGRQDVAQCIVEEAAALFSADFVTLWPYDSKFIIKGRAAVGIPVEDLPNPQRGRLTYRALTDGYLAIEDVETCRFLEPDELAFMRKYGIRSLQVTRLHARKEVGVLYVSYGRRRKFAEYARQRLETFAAHAALALANGGAFDQLKSANLAAASLAKLLPISDVLSINKQLASSAAEVVRCDAVTVYEYNESTGAFVYPPAMFGVSREDMVAKAPTLPQNSMVWRMLNLEQPLPLDNIRDHPDFVHADFPRREGISSCVVVPLMVRDPEGVPVRKVGVMFVNYWEPQRFTSADIEEIRFFADLAAIAIVTSQLNEARLAAKLEADKVLFRSLGAVSHSLLTPLHSVVQNTQQLERGTYGDLPPAARDKARRLVGLALTASRVTSNMLDIASIVEKRTLRAEKRRYSLASVVTSAVEDLRDEATAKNVTLSCTFDHADPMETEFDEMKIYAVVGNLLTNAIDAAAKGEVAVKVTKTDLAATVEVIDTGPGVPPHIQPFQGPFCAGARHVGIGLSISKEYVSLHQGTIGWKRDNDRTVFWFTLPTPTSPGPVLA